MSGESDNPDNVHHPHDQVETAESEAAAEHETASTAFSDAIDHAATIAQDAAQAANAKYQTAAESIRAHPFAAVLGGVAVGFILGRALR